MTKVIARLGGILGLETKDFVKGVNEAQQKSKDFKKNLKELKDTTDQIKSAFGLASVAFIGFAASAVHAADEIKDLADANEVGIGKILELKHALITSGGDASKVNVLFTSFTNAINDAAQGSDKLRDSFKAIGISTKDLSILTNEQLLKKAYTGLSQVDDVVRRNALAMELFGKAARGVDFANFAKNAEEVAGHYKDQEQAIKAAADAAQKVEELFHDIKIAALLAIKPVVDLFNKIPTEHRVEAITKAFQALGIAIGVAFGVTAVKGVIQLGSALRTLAITNPWLLALTAAGGAAAFFGLDKLLGGESQPEEPAAQEEKKQVARKIEISALDQMRLKYAALRKEVEELGRIQQSNIAFKNKYDIQELELEGKKFELTQNQYEKQKLRLDFYQKLYELENSRSQKLYEARKELELAPAQEQEEAKKLFDQKVKWIEILFEEEHKALNSIQDLRVQNFNAEYDRQRSWVAGWNEAFKEYQEAAERASDRGRQAFNSVMQNMETALRNFVQTGKFEFKQLVTSIVKDLLYAEMKAQATAIFGFIKSAVMGSSLFGSSPNAPIVERSYSGFASGGYVDRPSIVGENGPELFIPRTSGTVIPNGSWQQMASGGGGMTVNGPYIANVSAIDTVSFEQRLYASNKAIWAAGKYAEKSLMSNAGRT